MRKEILYTFTIRFANGMKKVKKISLEEQTLPFMVMRLRQQYVKAFIDWSGTNGHKGTTELEAQ
jgi:hypothetical protein